jgi:small subunit ribosomal protein S20
MIIYYYENIIRIHLEVPTLANIKSAKKRIKVINTKTARNKAIKTKVKTYIKKVEQAVAAKDAATAQEALTAAIAEISKATSKGIFHKNTAARKVSRLTKAVNSIA